MSSRRAPAASAVTLASGLSLAIVPAAILSVAGSLFTLPEQGTLAVVIMAATFAGQLAVGATVEARLATPQGARRVTVPKWLGISGVIAALAVGVLPPQAILLACALPFMLTGLEVARAVSVAERLHLREWVAAVSVGVGAVTAVLAGLAGASWALSPLGLGVAVAIAVRLAPVSFRRSAASSRTRGWILADTAITGVIYPIMNTAVLALLGPAEAVQFTAIATVSGALAIPLNFLRMRLLKEHSRADIVVSSLAVAVAAAAILVAETLGLFRFLFGDAWDGAALLAALAVACLWRSASLLTTIPFAALRRAGAVALVTALRATVSAATLVLALAGVSVGTVLAVFVGLLVAELGSAAVYAAAWHRVSRGTGLPS